MKKRHLSSHRSRETRHTRATKGFCAGGHKLNNTKQKQNKTKKQNNPKPQKKQLRTGNTIRYAKDRDSIELLRGPDEEGHLVPCRTLGTQTLGRCITAIDRNGRAEC